MSNYKSFQKQGGTQERERKRDRERGGVRDRGIERECHIH